MRRGEIWTAAGGPDYAGKPRPVVIVQDDHYDATPSITICGLTSEHAHVPVVRFWIHPSPENGLLSPSQLMADKITTIPKTKLGRRIGRLGESEIVLLNRAIAVFLGLAGSGAVDNVTA